MVGSTTVPNNVQVLSLEEFINHPPDYTEWVDGQLVEKTGMTFKHSVTQAKLTSYWRDFMLSSG